MSAKFLSGIDNNNQRIINVASPSAGTDAVNQNYVDAAIRGLDWKQEVVAASTANVTLATPGTTLDGVTLAANDRILLKDQTAPVENGIYIWTGSAAALTRALDANTATALSGATVTVQRGTVNADRVYRVTADDPITLGTTAITLAQVGAGGTTYSQGTGISIAGSVISIDTTVVTRKVAANCAAATSTAVTHNFGTRDVDVTVYDTTTFSEVYADVVHTDTNTVTVTFPSAPAAGAYRIVVMG